MNIQKIIINPLFVFLGVWAIVFLLLRMDVSARVTSLPDGFAFQAMLVAISAVIGYGIGFFGLGELRSRPRQFINGRNRLSFMIRGLFAIMCLGFLITVVVSGGIPILYYLTGSGPTYTAFGIPTVNGFINSLLLFVGTFTFWALIGYPSRRWIRFVFLICLAIPIIDVHRASFMSLSIQCAVVYIALRLRRINKRVVILALLMVFIIVVFSSIGNLRNSSEVIRQQAALQPEYEWMPTWAVWFYMYLTTPLSNFAQITTMNFVHTSGISTFSALTPTVVRMAIWGGETSWVVQELGSQTFNVASFALPLYLDWGWLGVIGFTGCLLALGGYSYRIFLRRHSLYDLFRLSVVLQVIILTVFANLFLTWGILFQLILALLFRKWLIRIDALADAMSVGLSARTG